MVNWNAATWHRSHIHPCELDGTFLDGLAFGCWLEQLQTHTCLAQTSFFQFAFEKKLISFSGSTQTTWIRPRMHPVVEFKECKVRAYSEVPGPPTERLHRVLLEHLRQASEGCRGVTCIDHIHLLLFVRMIAYTIMSSVKRLLTFAREWFLQEHPLHCQSFQLHMWPWKVFFIGSNSFRGGVCTNLTWCAIFLMSFLTTLTTMEELIGPW